MNIVAQRFLQAFLDHGVEVSQIPRLLPQVKFDDLQSSEKLLAVLTPEILDQTAQLLGIRSQWLEGADERIYEYLSCYKHPQKFFKLIASLNPDDHDDFYVQALTSTNQLDKDDPSVQSLVVVVAQKMAELGDEQINRYYVFSDGWDWGHPPCRIQLKAIARILLKVLGRTMPLHPIKYADLLSIREGKQIPRNYLSWCLISNPSLEDYALSNIESAVAKEVDELPIVLDYIEEHNLKNFSYDKPDIPQSPVEPPENSTSPAPTEKEVSKKSGKRALAQEEIWEPVRNAAKTLWAENNKLRIAAVIRRIKLMPIFKASKLSESAIRKHIADLAPDGIRGKHGR